jgi:peptidoglycan/LPS O-acetylase OafA/YrhL
MVVDARASATLKDYTIATICVAVWLLISPFVLSFVHLHYSMWNCFIVALVVAWIAGVRVSGGLSSPWLSAISALVGVWLIVSPWVFGDQDNTAVVINAVVVGLILTALGILSVLASQPEGPEESHEPTFD